MWSHRVGKGLKIWIGAAALLLLGGCGKAGETEDIVIIEQEEAGPVYEFGVAERTDVTKSVRVSCVYRQVSEQEVAFSISDRLVDRVYVEEGDRVTKGQLLAELSSRELERRIEDLEYRIARNQLLLEYVDQNESITISGYWVNFLYYSGMSGGDKENLDNRIADTQQVYRYQREDYSDALEADRAELAQLQRELKESRLYATVDGVVYDMKDNLEGSTSRLGETVMTIMDTSEDLFETEITDVAGIFKEGEAVSMTINYGEAVGQYELVPWHMDEWGEKQIFIVTDAPEGAVLQVGVRGTLQVVEDSREKVLAVPSASVLKAGDKYYVYVLGDDDMREVRWIETGLFGDDKVEVLSGLTEGEKVIVK